MAEEGHFISTRLEIESDPSEKDRQTVWSQLHDETSRRRLHRYRGFHARNNHQTSRPDMDFNERVLGVCWRSIDSEQVRTPISRFPAEFDVFTHAHTRVHFASMKLQTTDVTVLRENKLNAQCKE